MALKDWLDFGQAALMAWGTRELVQQPRDEAIRRLTAAVENMSADQFDSFESDFLESSLLLVDVNKRVRAMELYAMLKFMEVQKFGEFRGFTTHGAALG